MLIFFLFQCQTHIKGKVSDMWRNSVDKWVLRYHHLPSLLLPLSPLTFPTHLLTWSPSPSLVSVSMYTLWQVVQFASALVVQPCLTLPTDDSLEGSQSTDTTLLVPPIPPSGFGVLLLNSTSHGYDPAGPGPTWLIARSRKSVWFRQNLRSIPPLCSTENMRTCVFDDSSTEQIKLARSQTQKQHWEFSQFTK